MNEHADRDHSETRGERATNHAALLNETGDDTQAVPSAPGTSRPVAARATPAQVEAAMRALGWHDAPTIEIWKQIAERVANAVVAAGGAASSATRGSAGGGTETPAPDDDERLSRYAETMVGAERLARLHIADPGEAANVYQNARRVMAMADTERAELRAEVERLRGDLSHIRDRNQAAWDEIRTLRDDLADERAKVARVEALRDERAAGRAPTAAAELGAALAGPAPETSTFEAMLADPVGQYDPRGEMLASIADWTNAPSSTMSAAPGTTEGGA